jgi:hypothetical protein
MSRGDHAHLFGAETRAGVTTLTYFKGNRIPSKAIY